MKTYDKLTKEEKDIYAAVDAVVDAAKANAAKAADKAEKIKRLLLED